MKIRDFTFNLLKHPEYDTRTMKLKEAMELCKDDWGVPLIGQEI